MGATVAHPTQVRPDTPQPDTARKRLAVLLPIAAVLIVSRWAVFPRYLVTFDEINFAFSIKEFNPLLHQPQPPGYPLFVLLLKILSPWFPNVEQVFLAAGLLLSAASLMLVWQICDVAIGRRWAAAGPLLLLLNPVFWLSALTNPVRLSLAFGAGLVALCAWKARSDPERWLPRAAGMLGVAAGFQPTLPVILLPLLLWTAKVARPRIRVLLRCALWLVAGVALWLPFLIHATGGLANFMLALRGYSGAQFSGSSLLFGATFHAAVEMAKLAFVWSCLGVVSWIWLVPVAVRKHQLPAANGLMVFLAVWFVPGLLFYAIFHVGDPDHTLSIVPATCIAGAAVLAAAGRDFSRGKAVAVLSVFVLINGLMFFKPITKAARPSSYRTVRWLDSYTTHLVETFRRAHRDMPAPILFPGSSGEWRQISYYDQEAQLVVIDPSPGGPAMLGRVRGSVVLGRRTVPHDATVPVCGPIMIFHPAPGASGPSGHVWKSPDPEAVFAQPPAGQAVDAHGVRFTSVAGECGRAGSGDEVLPIGNPAR